MKVNTYLHKYLTNWLNKDMIVADCTMGNGNDTLFLAKHVSKVYAFDIQELAFIKTKEKTKDFQNIEYILACHSKLDTFIKEELDLAIFNLGYLPHSDTKITTSAKTSCIAILKAYQKLKKNGYLAITIYRGHPGALEEYHQLIKLFKQEHFLILESYKEHKHLFEPILFIIKKV